MGGILLLLLPALCLAAHSRRRIVVTRDREVYDRVITQFSPEGRLSQVEYGMEASRRGSTIAAATHSAGICLIVHKSSFGKIHRIDHHVWLLTAGLSGDARVLAEHLRQACQSHRGAYGEAPTIEEVARMAGEFQHLLTRSRGIRPLGCTALVVGIDPVSDEQTQLGLPRVFQTDPGGIVEECSSHCVAGKGYDAIAKDLAPIVAGVAKNPNSLSRLAFNMAQSVLGKLDETKVLDVWTIEPKRGKRGGLLATCYQKVDKDTLSTILDGADD